MEALKYSFVSESTGDVTTADHLITVRTMNAGMGVDICLSLNDVPDIVIGTITSAGFVAAKLSDLDEARLSSWVGPVFVDADNQINCIL